MKKAILLTAAAIGFLVPGLIGAHELMQAPSDVASASPRPALDNPPPPERSIRYSPYPEQNFPDQVLFGDTHLHTSYSTDAGMVGNRLGPDEAYRFAEGEVVTSSNGVRARLQRPLDFLVVTDHAENLGLAPMAVARDPDLLKTEFGRKVADLIAAKKGLQAYDLWMRGALTGVDPLKGQTALTQKIWNQITEAAERHNKPGRFSAMIGFEWSSGPNGNNLHRNVIFRDGKARADQVIPLSAYDTLNPEELWAWMDAYERKTGGRVLAIPHNGNLSSGLMFEDTYFDHKTPIDAAYARRRTQHEPVYEVTQMKGDSETHPALSPTDEFANFERWDTASFGPTPHTPAMLPHEYVREALKRGLAFDARIGANPFKFGMVGSTDSHTSLSTTAENNFFGKATMVEPTGDPIRFQEVIAGRMLPPSQQIHHYRASASGLAAVWARSNTREDVWDALNRKEVYATTGTRIRLRVFGGFNFERSDLDRSNFAEVGYARGVPMGGDLYAAASGRAPSLLIRALRDPDGANLDRIQVIKGWLDARGQTHERVFDVAWSGNRKRGANGKLSAIGNTVDINNATYNNSIGVPILQAFWTDPEFKPAERAFYYVRVLEIPTPRWTTIDAKVFGVRRPSDVPATIQERAYTSPIWYSPSQPHLAMRGR